MLLDIHLHPYLHFLQLFSSIIVIRFSNLCVVSSCGRGPPDARTRRVRDHYRGMDRWSKRPGGPRQCSAATSGASACVHILGPSPCNSLYSTAIESEEGIKMYELNNFFFLKAIGPRSVPNPSSYSPIPAVLPWILFSLRSLLPCC